MSLFSSLVFNQATPALVGGAGDRRAPVVVLGPERVRPAGDVPVRLRLKPGRQRLGTYGQEVIEGLRISPQTIQGGGDMSRSGNSVAERPRDWFSGKR
jgi:hypothetical protein